MYLENYPCSFKTEHGSQYTVGKDSLVRKKYTGGTSSNPKNIFYGDEDTTDDCAGYADQYATYRVRNEGFKWMIRFYDDSGVEKRSRELVHRPELGLYPVDMILNNDGTKADGDRFHIGDKITKID